MKSAKLFVLYRLSSVGIQLPPGLEIGSQAPDPWYRWEGFLSLLTFTIQSGLIQRPVIVSPSLQQSASAVGSVGV
ncbi:hypothetical protein AAFF_G00315250 [Aldrovandia affinis]|uniref:Uncharacterized protein n=1 Tax=Aldrovandia affinis TaxID=143900 RepID=A0AAD7SMV9_9TELE|nr:hypothetical protein AAFF_G00315250 [Aldrovandia affinis]